MKHRPPHIPFHERKHPIVPRRRTPAREKQKENGQHENSGERDAERDEDAELGKPPGTGQHQREKTDRGRERAEENGPAEALDRVAYRCRMIFAVVARLLVAAENEDGEIDSETNENRAEPDSHHVELAKNQETGGERDETAEQERNSHSEQGQPAAET